MNNELVDIFIPRKNKWDTERYVAVNGVNMLIQTGRTVSVPRKFAEVVLESARSDAAAEAFVEANTNK